MSEEGSDHDENLARRAKSGDRAAFEQLARRHKDELYRFVRRYVGQADDAYDVLQNSLVAAWLGLSRYDPARAFAPWLRTITLNKCRDFGRRQTVRQLFLRVLIQDQSPHQPLGENSGSSDEVARTNARLDRLDRAIADLPALYKEPLLLTTVSGLSHEEVAVLLKTSPKAVEMRLYRARRKLRTALRESEG